MSLSAHLLPLRPSPVSHTAPYPLRPFLPVSAYPPTLALSLSLTLSLSLSLLPFSRSPPPGLSVFLCPLLCAARLHLRPWVSSTLSPQVRHSSIWGSPRLLWPQLCVGLSLCLLTPWVSLFPVSSPRSLSLSPFLPPTLPRRLPRHLVSVSLPPTRSFAVSRGLSSRFPDAAAGRSGYTGMRSKATPLRTRRPLAAASAKYIAPAAEKTHRRSPPPGGLLACATTHRTALASSAFGDQARLVSASSLISYLHTARPCLAEAPGRTAPRPHRPRALRIPPPPHPPCSRWPRLSPQTPGGARGRRLPDQSPAGI